MHVCELIRIVFCQILSYVVVSELGSGGRRISSSKSSLVI